MPKKSDELDKPAKSIRVMYAKEARAWEKTIYIVGLPRSGKSTVFNVLASCNKAEALDEPFDLLAVAQKATQYTSDSEEYMQYLDLYHAFIEHNFSELVLGRSYNFRRKDKSCIYNYKSMNHIEAAHARARRLDVISYTKDVDISLVIAFNDVERSIEFLANGVPRPKFVHIKRNLAEVAIEIEEKNWLSDEQLSTQTNMTPAYNQVMKRAGKLIYLPYFIQEKHADLFMSMNNYERSVMYVALQDAALTQSLSRTKASCLALSFKDLVERPDGTMNNLIRTLELKKTDLTDKIIDSIFTQKKQVDIRSIKERKIGLALRQLLDEYKLDIKSPVGG